MYIFKRKMVGTQARVFSFLAALSHSIDTCLDSLTNPLDIRTLLKGREYDPEAEYGYDYGNILIETTAPVAMDGYGFVYITCGGVVFGIHQIETWASVPQEPYRYGQYAVMVGFHRKGSLSARIAEISNHAKLQEGYNFKSDWVETQIEVNMHSALNFLIS